MKRKPIIGPGRDAGPAPASPAETPGTDEIVRRYGDALSWIKHRLAVGLHDRDASAPNAASRPAPAPGTPPENPDDAYIRSRYGAALDRIRRHLVSPDAATGDPDPCFAVVRIDRRRHSIVPILVEGYRVNPDLYQPDWGARDEAVVCESAAFMSREEPGVAACLPAPSEGTLVLQSKTETLTGRLALQYQPSGVNMAVSLRDRNAADIQDFKLSVFDGSGRKIARRSARRGELKLPDLPPDSYRLEARAPEGDTCVMSLRIEKKPKRT